MPDRFHQLLLFDDKDFGGGHAHVFRSTSLGGIDWNGRVSAFAVTGGVWQFHRDGSFQKAYGSLFAPRIRGYSWVEDYDIDNDSLSSVSLLEDDPRRVPHLILFKKPHFGGDHQHLLTDSGDLSSWGDAGSLVIFAGLWQLEFIGAPSMDLYPGIYPSLPIASGSGGKLPQLVSISLLRAEPAGNDVDKHLILFDDKDFGGKHRHVFEDISKLDDGWDNVVSSLAVEFGAWRMYKQQNFAELQGVTLTRGIYPWVEDIEISNDSITSLQSLPLPASDPPLISQVKINGGVNAFTAQGENYRLGWNPHETTLTPENVRVPYFGRLWARYDLDGARVYATPLYLSNDTSEGVTRDIVIVATAANNVFALNAQNGNTIWQHNLGEPLTDGEFSLGLKDYICDNTSPLHGINSTPVIDPSGSIVYVAYLTKTGAPKPSKDNNYDQAYFLQALDVTSGNPVWANPVELKGTYPRLGRPPLPFLPHVHTQRGALTYYVGPGIRQNFVLIPFSSRCDLLSKDDQDWQGWIFAVDVAPYPPVVSAIFASSQEDTGLNGCGGIWGAAGLSIDDQQRVYAVTGNGVSDGQANFANSVLRLIVEQGQFSVEGYYTPKNWKYLKDNDRDLGGSSPLLLPPQPVGYSTPPPVGGPVDLSVIVTAGKDGHAYFVPADLPGRVDSSLSEKQREEMLGHAVWRPKIFAGSAGPTSGGIAAAVAYFDAGQNGRFLYVVSAAGGDNHGLVAIKLDDLNGETMLGARVIQFEGEQFTGAPGSPFVSSNGSDNGVVWVVDSFRYEGPGTQYGRDYASDKGENSVLRAWDAVTGRLLYSSPQTASQMLGNGRKFVGLTVLHGKVFVPAQGVACYGSGFEDV